jgi:DNA-binding transcriptional MerR regulator
MATGMKDLQRLPVMTPGQVMDHFAEHNKAGSEPGRVLVEQSDFIAMLEAVGGFELSPRLLQTYSSPRIKLIEPAVKVGGKTCYVFPNQFDRIGIILTLRQAYNLPLDAIRDLLEHYPREHYELLMERKFEIADLLDLTKLLRNGYGLKDLVMAKGCDVLLQDLMSSSKALSAAAEPGDTLRRLQEKLILGRLDEMKTWVSSGRWQEFLKRESAQDLKDLASKHLLHKKIVAKVLAKKARSIGRK